MENFTKLDLPRSKGARIGSPGSRPMARRRTKEPSPNLADNPLKSLNTRKETTF
jgi:hypothetical protein